MDCNVCGSDTVSLLGRLGTLIWFRCRACGSDQSAAAVDFDCYGPDGPEAYEDEDNNA